MWLQACLLLLHPRSSGKNNSAIAEDAPSQDIMLPHADTTNSFLSVWTMTVNLSPSSLLHFLKTPQSIRHRYPGTPGSPALLLFSYGVLSGLVREETIASLLQYYT